MSSRTFALYTCLLDDLSDHLPSFVIDTYRSGGRVEPWPDITPKQYASLNLLSTFYKKLVDEVEVTADAAALSKFLAVNEQCGAWSYDVAGSWEEELMGTVKHHLHRFFYHKQLTPILPNLTDAFVIGRCGPGASLGSVGQDEYTKLYSSDLTTTSSVIYRAYRSSLLPHPMLCDAEETRSAVYGEPRLVEGNRLAFVPKQRDISRVTCTEPVLNMYAQLGVGRALEDRLRGYFGIDLAIQPAHNRALACTGSLDGSYSTIDLSSASDSMSLGMLKAVLPSEVYSLLCLLRSPLCELPDGSKVALNMVSTMGNGFTFPLETILFAAVVAAVYDMLNIKRERSSTSWPGNWGVFGDDIVVRGECYGLTVRALNILGFQVNAAKSFFEGPFRESCGGDFFRGHPVRGVYVKTLKTEQARAVVLNRLHEWSAATGVFVSTTTRWLYSSLPKRFVPHWESYDAGIQAPWTLVEGMRRSKHLQSVLYRSWVPRRRVLEVEDFMSLARNRRMYNPSGLFASFLRGHIRSGKIPLRQRELLYTTKTRVAPSWDTPRKLSVTETDWRRWNTAVWLTVKG